MFPFGGSLLVRKINMGGSTPALEEMFFCLLFSFLLLDSLVHVVRKKFFSIFGFLDPLLFDQLPDDTIFEQFLVLNLYV